MMLINALELEDLVKYYDLGEFQGNEKEVIEAIARCLEEDGYPGEVLNCDDEELRDEVDDLKTHIGIPDGWGITTDGQGQLTICSADKSFTFKDPGTTYTEGENLAFELIHSFLIKQNIHVHRRS